MEEQGKELTTQAKGAVKIDWTHSNDLSDMLTKAEILVKSSLVPFKKKEDVIIVWQYAKDIGLSFSQAMTELYAIPGQGGTKVCAGVHIHEGLILASGKGSYSLVEEAVEVQHYKIKGLGTKIMTIDEVMEGIEAGKYQIVDIDDFDKEGNLTVEKNGKFLIMLVGIEGFDEDFVDKRTTIRFKRPDKGIDETLSYYLHEAGQAGFLAKSNWLKHETAMLYTRCFTRGSKRFFSDILKGLEELSEVAQYSNVPYEFDEQGGVTLDVEHEEVEVTREED